MKDHAAAPNGSPATRRAAGVLALELQLTTPMFGRSVEQAELLETLCDPSKRLVTLTGRGGVGKTRLAIEVMHVLGGRPGRRIVAVALAGVADAELVLGEIAAAIGLAHVPNVGVADALAARLGDDEVLMVLDNFEHVLPAAPALGDLLDRCPNTQMLVTSQAPLRLRLEQVRRLEPLPVPDPGESDAEVLVRSPSVAAYCERAAAVDSRFELHDGNAGAVGELCRQLEGLPLAIELAAARAATLPAAELLRRLDTAGLDVLRRRLDDAPERHHELRRTIAWTYQLIAPDEQRMLRRLSVISGTFDLDTVEALSSPMASADAIDRLAALVDLHLVDPIPGSDPARFHLPSSIRVFGRDELERSGEHVSVRTTHLALRARQARDAAIGVESDAEALWLNLLRADHDDLVAALETALGLERADEAIDLVAGLVPLWSTRGYYAAQERLVERTLELGDAAGAASIAFANVLLWSGRLGLQQGGTVDRDVLVSRMQRGEQLARELNHTATILRALAYRMLAVPYTGNVADANEASEEGLELADRAGEQRWLGRLEAWSGMLATLMGNDERAVALGRSAVARARRHGDQRTLVIATMMLMPLRRKHPEIAPDVPPTEEALRCARATGLTLYEGLLLAMMVGDAVADHDARGALVWAAEALEIARALPGSPVVGYNLMTMLSVAATCGDCDVAAYFHGAVRNDIAVLSLNMSATQLESHDAILAQTRATLGPERFDAQVRTGEKLAPATALDEARAYVQRAIERFDADELPPTAATESSSGVGLTGRQHEVLCLVVAGYGNREIAATLGISTKTAMHHTTAIYRTLGVRGRSEAIAFALRTGLVE